MISPDEPGFIDLTRRISREVGLSLDAYKDKCLRRRIAVRMRASGVHSYVEYQALLDRDPEEYERLKDAITINVTRFYRNIETWEQVRTILVPEICADPDAAIRAWSAGCSSGEEAYTLAVLIAEHLDAKGRPEQLGLVTIDATDVDRESLQRARAARYDRGALADVPPSLVQRYFEDAGRECRVAERVRARVCVRDSDLSIDPPPGRDYQLILCRNVVIYFGRDTQERVFRQFAEALAPGGFLVLGKVETLFGAARDRLTLINPRERIYRRAA
jgi:chemotaxis methyl-accepting protein methylase